MVSRWLVLGLAASLNASCASATPTPSSLISPTVTVTATTDPVPDAPALETILAGPTVTPFTEPPSLLNLEDVRRAQEREASALQGRSGSARVYFLIAPDGQVLERVLHESSGDPLVDAAALRVSLVHEFSPAKNHGEVVHVWILIPITLTE